ncbi:hypothetical protein MASR2M79_13280 [Aminivibrio sp.]
MPRIDSAKKRLEKIPAILKRFTQSVLTAAVAASSPKNGAKSIRKQSALK